MLKLESDRLRILNKPFCLLGWAMVLFLASELPAVEGGAALSDERWGFVLNIRSDAGSCSAARVSEKYAITAAHCVGSTPYQVYSGVNAEQYVGTARTVFVDPRYEELPYDIAVIEIDSQSDQPVVTVPIAEASVYRDLLAGKYPNRVTLAAGFGMDGQGNIWQRKWAFERDLSIFPSSDFRGQIHSTTFLGATRPGDSGGPILIRLDNEPGFALFGIVSGENIWETTFEDGGSDFDAIIRNAPVAASLCLGPKDIVQQIDFDLKDCDRIREFEEVLYGNNFYENLEADTKLWRAVMASNSRLHEKIGSYQPVVDEYVISSFESMDSIFARRHFDRRMQSTFWGIGDRREISRHLENRLLEALIRHGQAANQRYSPSVRNQEIRSMLLDPQFQEILYRQRERHNYCGNSPCLGKFFSGRIDKGTGYDLAWDFLTAGEFAGAYENPITFEKFKELACLGLTATLEGAQNIDPIVDGVMSLGFSQDFISIEKRPNRNRSEISAKKSDLYVNFFGDTDGQRGRLNLDVGGEQLLDGDLQLTSSDFLSKLRVSKTIIDRGNGYWGSDNNDQSFTIRPTYISIDLSATRPNSSLRELELVDLLDCPN